MDYKATLKAAYVRLDALQAEYATAEQKVAQVGQEIARLADVMTALGPLAGEKLVLNEVITEFLKTLKQSEALEVGITERIRQILESKPQQGFYPMMVRSELEAGKYDLGKHPNAMATIHSVLKRLVEQQYARLLGAADGKTAYAWNPNAPKR